MIRTFLKILAYLTSFIAAAAVTVFLVYKVLDYSKTGEVPMLVGISVTEATELLNKRKLLLNIEGKEPHSEIEEGSIVRQMIEPGRDVPVDTEVGVIVSSGQEIYSMPSFEDQSLNDAKLTLVNLGMKINKVTWVHSDTVEKGTIIAQRPLPGNIKSNKVNFLVSLGPYIVSYRCPSFVNMTIDDARILAGELGITLVEKARGRRVIFQKPEAGALIKTGETVEVKLGRGWGMWF
jgi:serine/threonine-protein kinase